MPYLRFENLDAPVHMDGPDEMTALAAPIFAAWPYRIGADPAGLPDPFARLSVRAPRKWELAAPKAEAPVALHNPVNAICDLIAEMSWERLRSSPDLLCLHAAAIAVAGRLVLFPNMRRAGKSLLTASLARQGFGVFTDDFVPLRIDDAGVVSGVANGIAPRLRLPLPANMSMDHHAWIMERIGPKNRQYGYLTGIDLPVHGTALPVGAIVLLARDEAHVGPATLTPVSRTDALAALVMQNFARHVHAGAILEMIAGMAATAPVLRLTYRDVEDAVTLIAGSPLLQDLPAARLPEGSGASLRRPAPVGETVPQAPAAQLAMRFARVAGFTEARTDDAIFLAGARGLTIQSLNPVAAILWELCAEPVSGTDLVAAMTEMFADVAVPQLEHDVLAALQHMVSDGLLTAG